LYSLRAISSSGPEARAMDVQARKIPNNLNDLPRELMITHVIGWFKKTDGCVLKQKTRVIPRAVLLGCHEIQNRQGRAGVLPQDRGSTEGLVAKPND